MEREKRIISLAVVDEGRKKTICSEEGKSILELLRANGYLLSTPCGGKGTCGKCKVVIEGIHEEVSRAELRHISRDELSAGVRLACCSKAEDGMKVVLLSSSDKAVIQTEGTGSFHELEPSVEKIHITLNPPSLDDQRADIERVTAAYKKPIEVDIEAMGSISGIIRASGFDITITVDSKSNRLLDVEGGDTEKELYGIAVDIGTTTVVGYLMDLRTGERIDVYSCMNPQRAFGGDVISRINHTIESRDGLDVMHSMIAGCINEMVDAFCRKNDISKRNIYKIVFAGNTTMLHFLLNLPAANIASSPFIPVITRELIFPAKKNGLDISKFGEACILPMVAGYIGADTVAAVAASGMHRSEDISLLVDIGTNGEIVLGNKDWMLCCSAAAGPAFEGAHIYQGTGGVRGAINYVKITDDVTYTTIADVKPVGICGSGIIAAVAGLLDCGVLDETGRLCDADELDVGINENIRKRITRLENMAGFVLTGPEDSKKIVITQKDVREVQLAKAAIAAGINILVQRAGICMDQVKKVYLAGGFGSFIDRKSAVRVGLIPRELDGRLTSIGNAAGEGAVMALLSDKCQQEMNQIKNRMQYIELSGYPEFQDSFVECMMFG